MIQVDMFEVQLGASLLLQLKSAEGTAVRVLADAGGYHPPPRDVHSKLADAFKAFGSEDRRIDLLIGTHYDADHLDGLIPIINDQTIPIGEAWLPPVANDAELHAFDEALSDSNLLATQFHSDKGWQVLKRYLKSKKNDCETLTPVVGEEHNEKHFPKEWDGKEWDGNLLEAALSLFKGYRDEAVKSLGSEPGDYNHANHEQFLPRELKGLLRTLDWNDRWNPWLRFHERLADNDPNSVASIVKSATKGSIAAHNLAQIRRSTACDAINAISLAKVANALRERGLPIVCPTIPDGIPKRFVWGSQSQRFEGGAHLAAEGPEITLLGPSESLVKKHWNRLPIGAYAMIAMLSRIPLKSITPSNQLSYVARFECEKQGILVIGDGGCVDFMPKPSAPYYPELLHALLPLHVVQVAHHAGNNAHFYRVLTTAKYPEQVDRSYLLVSHSTEDPYRPSREFRQFVHDLRREPDVVSILFTTQQRADKVREFKAVVHPSVGPINREGDVCIQYCDGAWVVKKHAIKV